MDESIIAKKPTKLSRKKKCCAGKFTSDTGCPNKFSLKSANKVENVYGKIEILSDNN